MKDLAIFVEESSVFAAPFLAEAIDCKLYVMLTQYNNFFQAGRMGIFWHNGKAITENHIIIIGYPALKAIISQISRFKSITYIASDSWSCANAEWIQKVVNENNITLYAMPDIQPYFQRSIPAYQTMRIRYYEKKPNKKIIIGHSPNNGVKSLLKGSPQIAEVLSGLKREFSFEYRQIQGLPMNECLKLKSECDIFVDQLIMANRKIPQNRWGGKHIYNGGLGKSGIEAMMLGCCVVTGGIEPYTERYFPPPPIIWTDFNHFKQTIITLLADPEFIKITALRQIEWAEKYLSYDFISHHITRHIY